MKTLTFKTLADFSQKITDHESSEFADLLFDAIKKGMSKNTKKVAVCDVFVEDEGEVFRLYSSKEEWPVALEGCIKSFIKTEEYEKCSEIQKISHEIEINKLVETTTKQSTKRNRKPKQSTDTNS